MQCVLSKGSQFSKNLHAVLWKRINETEIIYLRIFKMDNKVFSSTKIPIKTSRDKTFFLCIKNITVLFENIVQCTKCTQFVYQNVQIF